jgi:hypothetical protein
MEIDKGMNSQKCIVEWEVHQEPMRGGKRPMNQPSKRWGHSSVIYRHYLYLFGGNLSNNYYASAQSLFSFDLKGWGDTCWDRFLPMENEVCPSGRDGHSAVVIDNSMFILCGSKSGTKCNEVFSFDFKCQVCRLGMMQGTSGKSLARRLSRGIAIYRSFMKTSLSSFMVV